MLYKLENVKKIKANAFKYGYGLFIMILLFGAPTIISADRGYDLDDFDDLELQSLDKEKKRGKQKEKQRLILYDDNLYLLDDDFDFGEDELELQKLELNNDDLELAREYEDFLNVFFDNSMSVGNKAYNSGKKSIKHSGASAPNPSRAKFNPSSNSLPFRAPVGKMGFGVSTMIGASIPMGTNLKNNFGTGSNFGIHLDTPLSFNVGSMEGKVGTEIFFSSMTATRSGGNPYKLTNITGTISLFPLKSLELKAGLGLSPGSIGDMSKVMPSIPVDVNYYLPFKIKGFGIALNLHAQETLGVPTDDGSEDAGGGKATSEFINVGFFITTPLVF